MNYLPNELQALSFSFLFNKEIHTLSKLNEKNKHIIKKCDYMIRFDDTFIKYYDEK